MAFYGHKDTTHHVILPKLSKCRDVRVNVIRFVSVRSTMSSPIRTDVESVMLPAMYSVFATFIFRPLFLSDSCHAFTHRTKIPFSNPPEQYNQNMSNDGGCSCESRILPDNTCNTTLNKKTCADKSLINSDGDGEWCIVTGHYHPGICLNYVLSLCRGAQGLLLLVYEAVAHMWFSTKQFAPDLHNSKGETSF